MFYKEFIENAGGRLEPLYGRPEGRAIALRLLQHCCGLKSYDHIIDPFGTISENNIAEMERYMAELVAARPLQYVLGFAEFYGRNFLVEEGVLIPRSETEELVKWILGEIGVSQQSAVNICPTDNKYFKIDNVVRILDAACGSGCIGITLAAEIAASGSPAWSEVFAMDLSDKALEVTTKNAHRLLSKTAFSISESQNSLLHPYKADILAGPAGQYIIERHSLDIIVSNPPYVREQERALMHKNVIDFEPAEALFVSNDDPLVFYKALSEWGRELLRPGGSIYFEINEAYGKEVVDLLASAGYTDIILRKDINDKDRMVRGGLCRSF